MARKKPERLELNAKALRRFIENEKLEYEKLNLYGYRVFGASAIVDIYPSRMRATIHSIDGVEQSPVKWFNMDFEFNKRQVRELLIDSKSPRKFTNYSGMEYRQL